MQKLEITLDKLHDRIYFIRGHRVMLDSDLALLYQIQTKSLNQAVRRNVDRFPNDFMFQLTDEEYKTIRSQVLIENYLGWGTYTKYRPFVFTEQGVAMLSSVLKSKTAVHVNIEIMRTFVKLRGVLENNKELAKKLDFLERKVGHHDQQLKNVFEAIRQLMATGSPVTHKKIKGLGKD